MNRNMLAALAPLLLVGCSVSGNGQGGDPTLTEMASVNGGEATVGTEDETSYDAPVKQVIIPTFRIDKTEVTNGQYAACVAAGKCSAPTIQGFDQIADYYSADEYVDHPVVFVTWFQADAFCKYAGKRLPTELEWEVAARGLEGRTYPWGDAVPTCDLAQYGECNGEREQGSGPMKVGSLPDGATPEGILDLAGNVNEWVADWYDPDLYQTFAEGEMPTRPSAGRSKGVRGGSWYCESERMVGSRREAFPPTYAAGNLGFRCAE